jgi:protein-L-isoaspartate(D-aspartate) O-methyltransferase
MRVILLLSVLAFSAFPGHSSDSYDAARRRMVEFDIKGRGVADGEVLRAMSSVKRHLFVEDYLKDKAYADHPLPIGEGQTISQPYVVALMTELARVKKGDRVLEIGTGSGYQAAVLSEITDEVYSIEIRKTLGERATKRLKELKYPVKVKIADGYFGWPEYAPFDAILVTAAVNHIPPPLLGQLKDGGRLVVPLGPTAYYQTLTVVARKGEDFAAEQISSVRFVPLVGEALKK